MELLSLPQKIVKTLERTLPEGTKDLNMKIPHKLTMLELCALHARDR